MITEADLRAAIAECEGARNPTASTCVKLAAYYAILNQRNEQKPSSERTTPEKYSFASEPDIIPYGNSEFSRLLQSKGMNRCFPVIEELMNVLLVVDPKLYHSTLGKLKAV